MERIRSALHQTKHLSPRQGIAYGVRYHSSQAFCYILACFVAAASSPNPVQTSLLEKCSTGMYRESVHAQVDRVHCNVNNCASLTCKVKRETGHFHPVPLSRVRVHPRHCFSLSLRKCLCSFPPWLVVGVAFTKRQEHARTCDTAVHHGKRLSLARFQFKYCRLCEFGRTPVCTPWVACPTAPGRLPGRQAFRTNMQGLLRGRKDARR